MALTSCHVIGRASARMHWRHGAWRGIVNHLRMRVALWYRVCQTTRTCTDKINGLERSVLEVVRELTVNLALTTSSVYIILCEVQVVTFIPASRVRDYICTCFLRGHNYQPCLFKYSIADVLATSTLQSSPRALARPPSFYFTPPNYYFTAIVTPCLTGYQSWH